MNSGGSRYTQVAEYCGNGDELSAFCVPTLPGRPQRPSILLHMRMRVRMLSYSAALIACK
jgi:hypothetical protein